MSVELKPMQTPLTGKVAGGVAAEVLPNVRAELVLLKAEDDNAGRVYLGSVGVTTATGYPLLPGEEVVLPLDNLNRLFRICENAGDDLRYLLLR